MRIIDKNHDYYDYLADPTDTITFDRRGSFLLERSTICEVMQPFGEAYYNAVNNYRHMLLQCGGTFWVFLLTITKAKDDNSLYGSMPIDYDIELLATWKNYNKPNKLIDIRIIDYYDRYIIRDYKKKIFYLNRDKINPEYIKTDIDRIPEFSDKGYLGKTTYYISKGNSMEKKEYTIPLLYACGISNIVPALDIFTAIEEYFSIEKTKAERTEPLGATNNDKIIMHGFDTKTSFRGK